MRLPVGPPAQPFERSTVAVASSAQGAAGARESIPLSNPSISDAERRAVLEVLDTNALSLGPKLDEFEQAFGLKTRSPFAVAVNSGTSGLHLAVKGAELGPGDEVITTPFSFVASANCVMFEGATPVFVDVEPDTFNIDPAAVPRALSSRTRAILPVHVFGRPCNLTAILALARRHRLTVIEDACEAIGATYRGRQVGTFGQSGVFAFYPNKQITTGEGGMIVTHDPRIARLCRSWRNQGRDDSGEGLHVRLGYNYRLSEINCALGIAQLDRLDMLLARRAARANAYTETFQELVPSLVPPAPVPSHMTMSWFVYVVRLGPEFSTADRDAVIDYMRAQGVACKAYFTPIHLQPLYRDKFGYGPGDFPVCESIADRTIALPFFSELTTDQIATVCRTMAAALRVRTMATRRFFADHRAVSKPAIAVEAVA